MIMRKLIYRILARASPTVLYLIGQIKVFKILAIELGQWRSIKEDVPVDKDGNSIPWYTYPAIEYLKRLDVSDKSVFEWGSGNSSLFWAMRAKEVISIESDIKWFNFVSKNRLSNQKVILLERENEYTGVILSQDKVFDIIVIDGIYRCECSKSAVKCLSEGGLIVLDNSDWCPGATTVLRESGLTQIDFSGFGPANSYAWTTSLFLSRSFFNSFCFNRSLQPIGGVAPSENWTIP